MATRRQRKARPRSRQETPRRVTTIDAYLARLRTEQREALQRLRRIIRAAAPRAQECISHQLPAFRQGRVLVAFGATPRHCALHLLSDTVLASHGDDVAPYRVSKGTIRFAPGEPLPAALVRKLVMARIRENAAAVGKQLRGRGSPTHRAASGPGCTSTTRRSGN
jgi:uncharacterized protein YdhG (YjbR/CyaY superfamily)